MTCTVGGLCETSMTNMTGGERGTCCPATVTSMSWSLALRCHAMPFAGGPEPEDARPRFRRTAVARPTAAQADPSSRSQISTCHAFMSDPVEGGLAMKARLRNRLRWEIKRGTVAYIDTLARARRGVADEALLAACRVAAEQHLGRALRQQDLLGRIVSSQPGARARQTHEVELGIDAEAAEPARRDGHEHAVRATACDGSWAVATVRTRRCSQCASNRSTSWPAGVPGGGRSRAPISSAKTRQRKRCAARTSSSLRAHTASRRASVLLRIGGARDAG